MSNVSTQITAAPAPPTAMSLSTPARRIDRWKPLKKVLRPFASLRLTVVLFALSIFLVFCGTLAQMDNGLWAILSGYFRAWLAWIPFQVFFPKAFAPEWQHIPGGFPFLVGYTNVDTGAFVIQGTPVEPGKQPHLIANRDFDAGLNAPVTGQTAVSSSLSISTTATPGFANVSRPA